MEFKTLPDGRSLLPVGTLLDFEEAGGVYRITGQPVGYGGSGILYPAVQVTRSREGWQEEELRVALKECYPLIQGELLEREETGRIRGEGNALYSHARSMVLREKSVTGRIYNRGFRLVPIWSAAGKERISLNQGETFAEADNLYAVMERLDEKGMSLGAFLKENRNVSAYQSIRIINQVLHALQEVHESGFLHGDIQENNIFIKGVGQLPGQDVLSLIDFGAARELLEDGATEPIADRRLYTTSGYTAPECISGNDGSLRLTRAADLYSVGYLLLRMLTGKAMDYRALQLVVNGKYFYSRQARKIGCPSGKVEGFNRILCKALQKNPAQRYQSAEEMLSDTLRLERSLAPKDSALAAEDYVAFISYCHGEKSSQAAAQIQRMIEHYRIPKALRPVDGRKRPGRVFRDRTELASSTDMEIHLREALDHSEYLILLLSPGVPQAQWVNREIELFLEHHDREHILTLIVEGEPGEVYPDILRKNEKFDGKTMRAEAVEGLAADIRGADKRERQKKLKTEIYRLLAPMLGCGYDDLRQRQREYQMRRILRGSVAAAVLLAVVAGCIGWEALRIHENYWEALTRQARYLAQISTELLSEGDRMKAVAVALEALPQGEEDNSRPLVVEAEAALSQALYNYQASRERASWFEADRLLSMEAASAGEEVLCPDGGRLLTRDKDGTVYLWDLESGCCQHKWDSAFFQENGISGKLLFCTFRNDEEILLLTEECLAELETGSQKLAVIRTFGPGTYDDYSYLDCAISEDGAYLAVYQQATDLAQDNLAYSLLKVYDLESGEILYTLWEDALEAMGLRDLYRYETGGLAFDSSGRHLLAPLRDSYAWNREEEDWNAGLLLLVDLEKQGVQVIKEKELGFYHACFLEDGSAAAFAYPCENLTDMYEETLEGKLFCLEAKSGKELWSRAITVQKTESQQTGLLAAAATAEYLEQEMLVLWGSRDIYFLAARTGKIIWQCSCEESIAGIADLQNGDFYLGLEDGSIYGVIPQDQLLLSEGTNVQRSTEGCLYDARTNSFLLLSREKGECVLLKWIADESGEAMEGTKDSRSFGVSASGEYYVVYSEAGSGYPEGTLSFCEMESREEISSISVEYFSTGYWFENMPGADGSDKEIFYYVESVEDEELEGINSKFTAYDVKAGEVVWELYSRGYLTNAIPYNHGQPLFLQWADNELMILDLASGQAEELCLEEAKDRAAFAEVKLSGSGRYLLGRLDYNYGEEPEAGLVLYDRTEGIWTDLTGTMQEQGVSVSDAWRSILFVSGEANQAALCDMDQDMLCILELPSGEISQRIPFHANSSGQCQVLFLPGNSRLVLWGDDGYLKLWDLEQECLLMEDSRKLYYVSDMEVSEDGSLLFIKGTGEEWKDYIGTTGTGFESQLYLLDEDGRFYFYTDILYGSYLHYTNQITVYNSTEKVFYLYDIYTLDELIGRAKAVLDGYELGEAEKFAYFIPTKK